MKKTAITLIVMIIVLSCYCAYAEQTKSAVSNDGLFHLKYSPCQGQSNFAPLKTAVEGSRL